MLSLCCRRRSLPDREIAVPFAVGVVILIVAGTVYSFGVIGVGLKKELSLTEPEITSIQTAGLLGLYCGVTSGLFYDRFGARVTCIVASCITGLGYMVVWLSLVAHPSTTTTTSSDTNTNTSSPAGSNTPGSSSGGGGGDDNDTLGVSDSPVFPFSFSVPYQLIAFLFFAIGQGTHALYTAAMAVNLASLPVTLRGRVTGVLASTFALGTAIYTLFYRLFARLDGRAHNHYFAFLGASFVAVGALGALFLKPRSAPGTRTHGKYTVLAAGDAGENGDADASSDEDVEVFSVRSSQQPSPSAALEDLGKAKQSQERNVSRAADAPETDIYGRDLLKNLNFWILFFAMALEDGTAATFINKLGSIIASQPNCGCNRETLAVLFALTNAGGRFFWGIITDAYRHTLSPVHILMITMIGMFFSHGIVVVFPNELALATVCLGLCFGGLFSLGPIIVGELFGFKHFGTNWGLIVLAPAIGTLVFGIVYSSVYVDHIDEAGSNDCFGPGCFRLTFVLHMAVCFVGILSCIWLHKRTYGTSPKRR